MSFDTDNKVFYRWIRRDGYITYIVKQELNGALNVDEQRYRALAVFSL